MPSCNTPTTQYNLLHPLLPSAASPTCHALDEGLGVIKVVHAHCKVALGVGLGKDSGHLGGRLKVIKVSAQVRHRQRGWGSDVRSASGMVAGVAYSGGPAAGRSQMLRAGMSKALFRDWPPALYAPPCSRHSSLPRLGSEALAALQPLARYATGNQRPHLYHLGSTHVALSR